MGRKEILYKTYVPYSMEMVYLNGNRIGFLEGGWLTPK